MKNCLQILKKLVKIKIAVENLKINEASLLMFVIYNLTKPLKILMIQGF